MQWKTAIKEKPVSGQKRTRKFFAFTVHTCPATKIHYWLEWITLTQVFVVKTRWDGDLYLCKDGYWYTIKIN